MPDSFSGAAEPSTCAALSTSLLLDHFGLVGFPRHPAFDGSFPYAPTRGRRLGRIDLPFR
jgi:hypothetical protein